MKLLLILLPLLLAWPALAQEPPWAPQRAIPEQPSDDLTAAYQVCVGHQERKVPPPVPPTTHDYVYSGVWAQKCPAIEEAWRSRDAAERAKRDAADLEKINKAAKQLPK